MNNIGVIFAMEEELNELLKIVELKNEYNIFDIPFYECVLSDKKLVLAKAGVGKVNAARCCQILIDNMDIDCIFNIGVAGSVSVDVGVCDIVIGEKLVQHDFDITAFNHDKGYIPNIGTVYIESDSYLVKTAQNVNTDINVHTGVIASGDIFCTEESMSKKINTKFNALCVEMEGASIAQVCFLSHIPFLVIRSISDSIYEKDNKMVYEEFLKVSSSKVAGYLKQIILDLK